MTKRMPRQKPGASVQEVATPKILLDAVRRKLHIPDFSIDLAASASNAVTKFFITKEENALAIGWPRLGWGWLNPEFGKIGPWAKKCVVEAEQGSRIAMLVPASVGSNWWRDYVHGYGYVLLLNGRVTFVGHTKPYPKDLVLVLYAPEGVNGYDIWAWREQP